MKISVMAFAADNSGSFKYIYLLRGKLYSGRIYIYIRIRILGMLESLMNIGNLFGHE